ncbi:MAG TPA: hypothetical protein VFX64_03570 [Candidatus Nitrosotalea sp.]|nr:hypothetical protein [Candidatus Nitrosotalea sp.]
MIENTTVPTYEWKEIGTVGVDTGEIIIADPANVLSPREYDELHKKESEAKLPLYIDFKHGMVSKTGFADGLYHVFAKFGDFGNAVKKIMEIRIVFDMVDDVSKESSPTVSEKKDDLSKGVKL